MGRARDFRSLTTHALAATIVVGFLAAAPLAAYVLFEGHWPAGYLDAVDTDAGSEGLGFAVAVAASILWTQSTFRPTVLRGLPLNQVCYARLVRRGLPDHREELVLDLRTCTDQVAVRLGDNVARSYYSPASLRELADTLAERPDGEVAATQLRALADDPSVRSWPVAQ